MAKKRANGEGNIRKRKDGRWEGRYTAGIDPETGKPIAKSVLARTQRECKEKLQKAMEELEKIDVTKRRDYTVGEWVQLWYENYAKPSVRASTAAYYKNYIDQHIVPRIGDIKLAALTTLQIQKFYNETKAHGRVQRYENMDDLSLSNKTIRGLHTMLRQCLEQAVTERLIPYNPANGCRLPKKEKKKMQIIPPEKIRDYLKAAEEWGVLPMFYLELSTGLRRGELVALLWSDLNLQTKTLTVSKSVSRGKGELVVTEPKTENSVREIYLSDEAIRLLVEDRKITRSVRICSRRPRLVECMVRTASEESIKSCSKKPGSRNTSDSTTSDTHSRRWQSKAALTRKQSRRSSVTPRRNSRWTFTHTSQQA